MRPDDHRARLKQASIARGRMYLKSHLGFLPGYPLRREPTVIVWMPAPDADGTLPDEVRLTAEHLRAATHGWYTLCHRFPKALARIVDDVPGWKRAVPLVLDLLSRAIHTPSAPSATRGPRARGGPRAPHAGRPSEPFPETLFTTDFGFSQPTLEQAARLARSQPALRPVLDALSWLLCLTPAEASGALAWLEENRQAVVGILGNWPGPDGLRWTLLLRDLARQDGDRRVAVLMDALAVPSFVNVATSGTHGYLRHWTELVTAAAPRDEGSSWPVRPSAGWAAALLRFVRWLPEQPAPVRHRALDLLAAAVPGDLLQRWSVWWEQAEPEIAVVRKLVGRSAAQGGALRQALAAERQAAAGRLQRLAEQMPPDIERHEGVLLNSIQRLSRPESRTLAATVHRMLRRMAGEAAGVLPRAEVLQAVASWLHIRSEAQVQQVLRGLAGSAVPPACWNRLVESTDFCWDVVADQADLRRTLPALAYWLVNLSQTEHIDWPIALSQILADGDTVRACLRDLARGGDTLADLPGYLVRMAAEIAPDARRLIDVARALERINLKTHAVREDVQLIGDVLARTPWQHCVAEAVLDGDLAPLTVLAAQLRLAQDLAITVQPPAAAVAADRPAWTDHYPPQLHGALTALASVTPDAEPIAGRLLRDAFPQPAAVRQEIQTLAARLAAGPAEAHLARRLDNLRRRLEPAPPVSAARLKRLDGKLRRATRRLVLTAWQRALQTQIETRVPALLGTAAFPVWLRNPAHQRAFSAVLRLKGWAHELGLRLLRLRCGPPPWGLPDEPANQRFFVRLRAAGIAPEPWLRPPAAERRTGRNGAEVRLSFESDPLEILQMGAYFQTCLSPGECNFFSTVANAADGNKHVVFARDKAGHVVGRCLLALSESGGLMAFRPYCHDPELGFDSMIGDLVAKLAARMKTVVIRRGTVPALVAGAWYDDGAIELGTPLPWAADGSALRQALPEVELERLPPLLEEALDPLPLNALTLPPLLALAEFQARPELVLPLLPRIERSDGLAIEDTLRAAELGHQAGAERAARRLLRTRAVPALLRWHRAWQDLPCDVLQRMVPIDPSLVLRVLRATRPPGVRSDQQELFAERRRLLAQVHTALGRPHQARRLAVDET